MKSEWFLSLSGMQNVNHAARLGSPVQFTDCRSSGGALNNGELASTAIKIFAYIHGWVAESCVSYESFELFR